MVVQEDDCNLLVSGHSKKGCRQAAEAEDVTDRNSAITAGGIQIGQRPVWMRHRP